MADTFQNLDLEKINADVKKQVDEILAGIDLTEINTNVEKILKDIETKKDTLLCSKSSELPNTSTKIL